MNLLSQQKRGLEFFIPLSKIENFPTSNARTNLSRRIQKSINKKIKSNNLGLKVRSSASLAIAYFFGKSRKEVPL